MHSSGSLGRRLLVVAAAALAVAAIGAPSVGAIGHHQPTRRHANPQPTGQLPYQNATLPIEQRVQDLLSRMTLPEKIGQMTQAERGSVDADTSKITTVRA